MDFRIVDFTEATVAAAPPVTFFDSGVATGSTSVTGFISVFSLVFEPALRMGREDEKTYTGSRNKLAQNANEWTVLYGTV
jgi:hypothetical protein